MGFYRVCTVAGITNVSADEIIQVASTKREFPKLFYDSYGFWTIVSLEIRNSLYIAYDMKNRFLVMYYLFPLKQESAKTICTYILIDSDITLNESV